jgi:hypothetical protein
MSTDPTADTRGPGAARSGRRPLSNLHRDIGLATVATEFNLQLDTLEPDVAKAVERGATALLLAGFGPGLTRRREVSGRSSKAAVTSCDAWRAWQDSPGGC